jgi:ubiquinone/menaquinone biosynthesis C-methylase UbiE
MSLSDGWEQEAENWIRWARTPGHDSYWRFHRDQFLGLLPPPGNLTVDIGCGEGRLPRDLKKLGHNVIGIDVSRSLIDAARKADPSGDYRCANAASLPLEDKSCDLVTAFMSLHDVDDLTSAVAEMSRIQVEDGVACIAIVHPINSAGRFTGQSADSPFVIDGTYLGTFGYSAKESRNQLQMTFHSRHRPIETYSKALEEAGFLIEAIREPATPPETNRSASSARWQRLPLFLHMRARKNTRG